MTTPEIKVEADPEVQVTVKLDLNLLMQLVSAAVELRMPNFFNCSLSRNQLEKRLNEEPKAKTFYFEHRLWRTKKGDALNRHQNRCREIRKLAREIMGGSDPEVWSPPSFNEDEE